VILLGLSDGSASYGLLAVADQAMQPTMASLWLRARP
jgi:hypothetical protein